ncbi:DsbA family oxidoreductase [Streptomyces heilongjiangensis]|uniref:DsbA family oxidoreductase n=1 Tax=Streptomyces heilongjiangensis TaxID=945052 RepID=A0ABW1BBZ4_9ACTN|nr:DsbA family oxidoreductase [Streptomyces heilongjiangensis]MDC2948761.1 DsbA family oxidoreductase [Streptomyces heilongjiangensis]
MQIEIYSDPLCPWCFIGKRRIASALGKFTHRDEVRVVWRSFELDPGLDRKPGATAAESMEQWMDPQAVPARVALIRSHGDREGLDLNLHRSRPVNTFDAHRLIQLAADRGRAEELLEAVFHAYHTEGLDIADHQVLLRLAAAAGLDAAEAGAVLDGDAYAERVRADERRAAAAGVNGVPSLVVDGGTPVSGVQDPDALLAVLEHAFSRRGG